jgi:small subunit ribosomal protein S20
MANTKSAKKEARKSVKRTLHNKDIKTRLKSLTRNARAALEGDDVSSAQKAVSEAVSAYDKAAKSNIVHKNKARRIKSAFSGALAAKS